MKLLPFAGLANRFGYKLAFDREPAAAIEADFMKAAASPHEGMCDETQSIVVKYFEPNSTGLFALVECAVPVAESAAVLLELIVSGKGEEKYIAVEDISGVST